MKQSMSLSKVELFDFQKKVLEETKTKNKVAYYLDMGLGKTYVGAEKAISLGKNILVICQKSKIDDWIEHFQTNYIRYSVFNLTKQQELKWFSIGFEEFPIIGIINYELAFRRPELSKLKDFTLMLDESSLIQNEQAKRSRFILKKLNPENIILLSGTPTSGKYERLWSQLHLLGWSISKELFWNQYVDFEYKDNEGFPIKIVKGYKNFERLKKKMHDYGCVFMKTEEVFELPEQIFNDVKVNAIKEYQKFRKTSLITINEIELVGDSLLTKMLYERMLCGHFNENKIKALKDLLESTEDRILIFYNFNDELKAIEDVCLELNKPISIINGQEKDLSCYEQYDNSVTLIQYQAGSMGLNLQKANKIIYFTPPLSVENYMQSKKRIHRIGQNQTCFYYKLICRNSIEEKIYKALEKGVDYTDKLFEQDCN